MRLARLVMVVAQVFVSSERCSKCCCLFCLCGFADSSLPLFPSFLIYADFTVPYKLAASASSCDTAPVPRLLSSAIQRLRVLIVEDDDLNALVMQTFFEHGVRERCGWHVTVHRVSTGEDALRAVGDGTVCPFDLMVVDQHLEPGGGVMKGSDFVREISRRQYHPQPPLLAMASVSADDEVEAANFRANGVKIIWPKPYPPDAKMVSDILRFAPAMFSDLGEVVMAPPPVRVTVDRGAAGQNMRDFDWKQARKCVKDVLWSWTSLPVVPGARFRAERLRLVSQRDLTFVRVATGWLIFYCSLSHMFWPLIENETRAWLLFVVLTAIHAYFVWNPKRWQFLVYLITLGLSLTYCQILWLVVHGTCSDPDTIAHYVSDTKFCAAHNAGDPDILYSYRLYIANIWIFFFGGMALGWQLFIFGVHNTILTTAWIIGTAPINGYQMKIAHFVANSLQLVWILIILERNWRLHFLETRAKETLVDQQKTLVSLLW